MNEFARLQSNSGAFCKVYFDFKSSYEELVEIHKIDFLILATENGFSPLGLARNVLSRELAVPESKIVELADWNRFENNEISIVGIKSINPESRLKGCVLAACENSKCYKEKFSRIHFDSFDRNSVRIPDRDFYYNITYESIFYAVKECNAKRIGISHLSASGNYHQDIAMCTAEALAHFHDAHPGKIENFAFVGCCITENHLRGTQRLNNERNTRHIEIGKQISVDNNIQIINLDIRRKEWENV